MKLAKLRKAVKKVDRHGFRSDDESGSGHGLSDYDSEEGSKHGANSEMADDESGEAAESYEFEEGSNDLEGEQSDAEKRAQVIKELKE